jgi:hypothetical protein
MSLGTVAAAVGIGAGLFSVGTGIAGMVNPPKAPKAPDASTDMQTILNFLLNGGGADQLLKLQKTYGPEFAQNELALAQQLSPQFAQLRTDLTTKFLPQMSKAYKTAQIAADPEFFKFRDQLQQQLTQNMGQGMNPQQLAFYREQTRQSQAAKGMFDSPLGSEAEAQHLTQLNMAQQNLNLLNAMNFSNSFRQTPMPNEPQISQANAPFAPPSISTLFDAQRGTSDFNVAADYQQNQQNQRNTGQFISGLGQQFDQIASSLQGLGVGQKSGVKYDSSGGRGSYY